MQCWVRLFAVAFILVACVPLCVGAGEDEARQAVADAEISLRTAFKTVLNAEAAGANTSVVVERLTAAGDLLTEAETALTAGDFSLAFDKAETCMALTNSTRTDAEASWSAAETATSRWWIPVITSVLSSCVFLVILFLVWRSFRYRFDTKLLKSKPEVKD